MSWTLEGIPLHLADGVAGTLSRLGNSEAAFRIQNAILLRVEKCAKNDPLNTDWQWGLSVSYERLGDLHKVLGERDAALERYRASLEINERLVKADPLNTEWQQGLSVSYNKLGDLHVARGEGDAALERYRASFEISERLVEADPLNTDWQRGLIVSYVKFAEVGFEPAAQYRRALEIAKALAQSNRLAPEDQWMLGNLENRLSAAQRSDGE